MGKLVSIGTKGFVVIEMLTGKNWGGKSYIIVLGSLFTNLTLTLDI